MTFGDWQQKMLLQVRPPKEVPIAWLESRLSNKRDVHSVAFYQFCHAFAFFPENQIKNKLLNGEKTSLRPGMSSSGKKLHWPDIATNSKKSVKTLKAVTRTNERRKRFLILFFGRQVKLFFLFLPQSGSASYCH